MQFSYWEKASWLQNTDHLVVGAGIVGLFTALFLKERHPTHKVLVVEKDTWGGGGSTKNAGFACFGSPSEVLEDLQSVGKDTTHAIIEERWKGLQLLRSTLGDEHIGFNPCGGVELFSSKQEVLLDSVRENLELLNELTRSITGEPCYKEDASLPFNHGLSRIETAFFNPFEGAIHTGKMYKNLLKKCRDLGIDILHGLEVQGFEEEAGGVKISLRNEQINTAQLYICTNGFTKELLPELDVHPARNLVLVTNKIPDLKLNSTYHMERGYFYFRPIEGRVLIGGGRHLDSETEDSSIQEVNPLIKEHLKGLLREEILGSHSFEIDYEWTGFLGVGKERAAIVKRLTDRIRCGVRMGGMGVAIGSRIGRKMAYL